MQLVLYGFVIAMAIALLGLLITSIPVLQADGQLLEALDSSIAFILQFFDYARWFLPVDIFVLCFTTILVVDNWKLLTRLVQYIIGVIRG